MQSVIIKEITLHAEDFKIHKKHWMKFGWYFQKAIVNPGIKKNPG